MKHPADGIYYVTGAMLRKRGACGVLKIFMRTANVRQMSKPVPITLDLLEKFHRVADGIVWAASRLVEIGAVSWEEEWEAFCTHGRYNPAMFMDLLAARAKREGRL